MALAATGWRGDLHHQRTIGTPLAATSFKGPAAVSVFPAKLRRPGLPFLRNAPGLQVVLLGLGVPLPGRLNDRGVDHPASHREAAPLLQMRVEAGERNIRRLGFGRMSAEQPDRPRIRNPAMRIKPREPHEAETVPPLGDCRQSPAGQRNLELGPPVRQPAERLQDQNLEHQHRVHGRPTALRPVRTARRRIRIATEHLEIHHRREPLQRIARFRRRRMPLIQIKQSRLPSHQPLHP